MSHLIIIGVISVLAGLIISRFLAEKALTILSKKEKADLVDEFADLRKYGQIPIIVALAIYMGIEFYGLSIADTALISLLVVFFFI